MTQPLYVCNNCGTFSESKTCVNCGSKDTSKMQEHRNPFVDCLEKDKRRAERLQVNNQKQKREEA